MLKRLEKPVHITFFHDPMMRETVELYQLMAANRTARSRSSSTIRCSIRRRPECGASSSPAPRSSKAEGRKLQINGPTETEIANGILRISQGAQQTVCFLDGHGEPDPFSLETHDHMEGNAGHSHGIGAKLVMHERHGIAKARHGLEAMNYVAKKVSLMQANASLADCGVLVVAGPKTALLPAEVKAIERIPCRRRQCVLHARSVRQDRAGTHRRANSAWCWTRPS